MRSYEHGWCSYCRQESWGFCNCEAKNAEGEQIMMGGCDEPLDIPPQKFKVVSWLTEKQKKWDQRFLEQAKLISTWSKDPSTKVGAVTVTKDNRIVSCGFNGIARGVDDKHERYQDRNIKIKIILHAEENAFLFASQSLEGCTLYTWPFGSCAHCAAQAIQKGIKRVVSPPITPELASRWGEDMKLAKMQFEEAGVEVVEVELEEKPIHRPDCKSGEHFWVDLPGSNDTHACLRCDAMEP